MEQQDLRPGYVYHIKEEYFALANDNSLMRNHEGGAYRPTYYCLMDAKTNLMWVIPMSSQVEKYQPIIESDTVRHGSCVKIVVGEYGGKKAAFLLQNMFPILPQYIDHIHIIKQKVIRVDERLAAQIDKNFRSVRRLHARGARVVFPDIDRLEHLMLAERERAEAD